MSRSEEGTPIDTGTAKSMDQEPVPFVPLRWTLYQPPELFAGFDPQEAESFSRTADFRVYRHYVAGGGAAPYSRFLSMMQALHDQSITQAARPLLKNRRIVAIMGGHRMPRNDEQYRNVARLSWRLTREGLLVCTGGGPGAMEATHLGAALAGVPAEDLEDAVSFLAQTPNVPDLGNIVAADGAVNPELVAAAHRWFAPAYEIALSVQSPGQSLAIPTWHYGHEPSTPLATHIAKYFQNSIREEGLLAVAKNGIIYSRGKAGTIQEVFQDATQNYYRTFSYFSPMVMLGSRHWTETLPVVPLLKSLFTPEDFQRYVLVTDDIDAAADFVLKFKPD